jgi:hypothetical protein
MTTGSAQFGYQIAGSRRVLSSYGGELMGGGGRLVLSEQVSAEPPRPQLPIPVGYLVVCPLY